jgi:hypothetical protein
MHRAKVAVLGDAKTPADDLGRGWLAEAKLCHQIY